MATWPSGKAEACKAFIPGSNLGVASSEFSSRRHPRRPFAFSAATPSCYTTRGVADAARPRSRGRVSRMRIGFFTDTYTPQINGVVTSICLFKKALEDRGHEVFVFAPTPITPRTPTTPCASGRFPSSSSPRCASRRPSSLEALRVLDDVELDVVHCARPLRDRAVRPDGRAAPQDPLRAHLPHALPRVRPLRVGDPPHQEARRATLARVLRACTSIIAPSTKVERYLRDWGVKGPIDMIATGVDVAKYAEVDDARIAALREKAAASKPDDRVAAVHGAARPREERRGAPTRAVALPLPECQARDLRRRSPRKELEEMVDELSLEEPRHLRRLPRGCGHGRRVPPGPHLRVRIHHRDAGSRHRRSDGGRTAGRRGRGPRGRGLRRSTARPA